MSKEDRGARQERRLDNLQRLFPEAQGLRAAVGALLDDETRTAYKNGLNAGRSQTGYRLVEENERLRRELAQALQQRKEDSCPTFPSAPSATGSGASAGEP